MHKLEAFASSLYCLYGLREVVQVLSELVFCVFFITRTWRRRVQTEKTDIYFNSVTHFIPTEPTNKIPSLQHLTLPQFKQSVASDEYHNLSVKKTCRRLPVARWGMQATTECSLGDGALSCASMDSVSCIAGGALNCAAVCMAGCAAV